MVSDVDRRGVMGGEAMTMRIVSWVFFVIGAAVFFAGWLLLCFDAIYLVSFPLSRLGAALPGTLALVEALVVGVLAYRSRKEPLRYVGEAASLMWLFIIANIVFVVFFWGGL